MCRYEFSITQAMNARLLSFLNLVQDAVARNTGKALEGSRYVNFHKGLACLSLKEGGSIQVQSFVLADGQACLKVAMTWSGCANHVVHAVYPTALQFDWNRSAEQAAEIWIAGPEASGVVEASGLAAVG